MPRVPGFRRNFRFPWRSASQIHDEIDTELAFHLDMRAEELEATGLDPAAARSRARREFGDLEAARAGLRRQAQRHESHRQHFAFWQDVGGDLRFAIRTLGRSPGFTSLAIFVLALGIGANTAIFSLVNVLLLKPTTVERPQDLVGIYSRSTETPDSYRAFSYPAFRDIRDANTGFASVTAFDVAPVGLGEQDLTRRAMAFFVAANYFETFGVDLPLGRAFTESEELPSSGVPVVILGHRLWTTSGADPDVLGTTRTINGRELRVVGVAPEGFTGTTAIFAPDIYLPLGMFDGTFNQFRSAAAQLPDAAPESLSQRTTHTLMLVGRLAHDASLPRTETVLEGIATGLAERYPESDRNRTFVTAELSRTTATTRPRFDHPAVGAAVLVMGMAAVVLLIACLNLANMLMARGVSRRTEVAVRAALGGGRARLLRQLLTEGLLLALAGGFGGLLVAAWLTRSLAGSILSQIPFGVFVLDTSPDSRVVAATLTFSLLATVFFALGPAWRLTRPELVTDLKEHSRGSTVGGHGRLRSRNVLIVAQIALSLALLTAGGLFVRGMGRAASLDAGFEIDGQILVETDPSLVGYDEGAGKELYRELLAELRALPGVEGAGLSSVVPFGNFQFNREARRGGGVDPENKVTAHLYVVSDGYFDALGLPVLRGREFDEADMQRAEGPPIAIVDEPTAARLWPDGDALDDPIEFVSLDGRAEGRSMRVVGVVPGLRQQMFDEEPVPHVYLPMSQAYRANLTAHVRLANRSQANEAAMLPVVRDTVRTVDEKLPVLGLRTMREQRDQSLELWAIQAGASIFTVFGVVALLLAVVGLYGVKAFVVSQRTREFGIRMAMGATRADVLRLVLKEGAVLAAVGLGIGLLLALGTGQLLSRLLVQVSATDPLAFFGATLVLALAALVAAYIPGRRATRVPPASALHHE